MFINCSLSLDKIFPHLFTTQKVVEVFWEAGIFCVPDITPKDTSALHSVKVVGNVFPKALLRNRWRFVIVGYLLLEFLKNSSKYP